jgi:hypothetical protein
MDKAVAEGFNIIFLSKGEINLFLLPLCKLQQSLARRWQ